MITKAKEIAYNIVMRMRRESNGRTRKSLGFLDEINQSREVAEAFFAELETEGTKQLAKGMNAIADNNQLDYLDNASPDKIITLLGSVQTLRVNDPKPEDETMSVDELMVQTLYLAERLNKHPDTPHNQDGKFQYIPQPDGNVVVGDDIPQLAEELIPDPE